MQQPDLSEARRLLGAGFKLVQLKPESKAPAGIEWNKHPIREIDDEATGYGVLLAANKLCSIDPDRVDLARIGMRALGFDLDQLMAAGVRTVSTRPGSGGRSTFAAEGDLSWLKFSSRETGTVLELRANSDNLQDAVPGLVYRDKAGKLCTQQYGNCRKLDEAPPLPDGFYEWWQRCSDDLDYLHDQQGKFFAAIGQLPSLAISGKGGKLAYQAPGIRSAFNAKFDAEDLLSVHGYTWHPSEQRWAPPTATGEPGVRPIPGKPGLWRSDHASDPLAGTFDAWTVHVVLNHQGDLAAAIEDAKQIIGPVPPAIELPPVDVYESEQGDEVLRPSTPQPPRLVLRHLADIVAERREPAWLEHRVLERNVRAVLAGARGTFKSFIAQHWAMKAACAGHPVVMLSGEGAGLDRRTEAWMQAHGQGYDLAELPIRALERPLNLNLSSELLELREAIGGQHPALIVIDTFSKFSAGLDENSNAEVATYLSRLTTELGLAYQATILLVAHTGHGDARRPRGASALMANPDSEFVVTRSPDSMTVQVSRERFKDYASLPPLNYEAEVIDLGRVDQYGDPVTSLALRTTDAPAAPLAAEPRGKAQRQLLEALRARRQAGSESVAYSLGELRDIGRQAGMSRHTARSAVEALAFNTPFLTPTVGGYRLSDDA